MQSILHQGSIETQFQNPSLHAMWRFRLSPNLKSSSHCPCDTPAFSHPDLELVRAPAIENPPRDEFQKRLLQSSDQDLGDDPRRPWSRMDFSPPCLRLLRHSFPKTSHSLSVLPHPSWTRLNSLLSFRFPLPPFQQYLPLASAAQSQPWLLCALRRACATQWLQQYFHFLQRPSQNTNDFRPRSRQYLAHAMVAQSRAPLGTSHPCSARKHLHRRRTPWSFHLDLTRLPKYLFQLFAFRLDWQFPLRRKVQSPAQAHAASQDQGGTTCPMMRSQPSFHRLKYQTTQYRR